MSMRCPMLWSPTEEKSPSVDLGGIQDPALWDYPTSFELFLMDQQHSHLAYATSWTTPCSSLPAIYSLCGIKSHLQIKLILACCQRTHTFIPGRTGSEQDRQQLSLCTGITWRHASITSAIFLQYQKNIIRVLSDQTKDPSPSFCLVQWPTDFSREPTTDHRGQDAVFW